VAWSGAWSGAVALVAASSEGWAVAAREAAAAMVVTVGQAMAEAIAGVMAAPVVAVVRTAVPMEEVVPMVGRTAVAGMGWVEVLGADMGWAEVLEVAVMEVAATERGARVVQGFQAVIRAV